MVLIKQMFKTDIFLLGHPSVHFKLFKSAFPTLPVAILAQVRNVWLGPLRGASGFCKPPREECQAVVRLVVRLVVVVLHGRLQGLFRLVRLGVVRLPVGPSGRAPVGSRAPLPIGLSG